MNALVTRSKLAQRVLEQKSYKLLTTNINVHTDDENGENEK